MYIVQGHPCQIIHLSKRNLQDNHSTIHFYKYFHWYYEILIVRTLKRFLLIFASLIWVSLYIDILLPNDHRIGLEEVGSWYRKMCFRNQKVFLI